MTTSRSGIFSKNPINTDQPSLLSMPAEILYHLSQLTGEDELRKIKLLVNLRKAHPSFQTFFESQLEGPKLLAYVLKGRPKEAKAIYSSKPFLLFIQTVAQDEAAGIDDKGNVIPRIITTSPLRAMAATGDFEILEDALNILASYIDPLTKKPGLELAYEQLKQQFPNGFDYPVSTYDFEELITVFSKDKIIQTTEQPSEETKAILNKFRKNFNSGETHTGYFNNLNHLIRAIQALLEIKRSAKWYKNPALEKLFSCQVIGYLQRLKSVFTVQLMKSKPLALVRGRQAEIVRDLPRLKVTRIVNHGRDRDTREMAIYPLDSDPSCRLGLEFCMDDDLARDLYGTDYPCVYRDYNLKEPLEAIRDVTSKKLNSLMKTLEELHNLNSAQVQSQPSYQIDHVD